MQKNITKPLGAKSYGSIPHLLGSKIGDADHRCNVGQHKIATEKTRDKHDLVIVQVKYDGSNVAVAKIDGKIIPLTRSGYFAESSQYIQHHVFAKWVHTNEERFSKILDDGDRICGEWMLQAHGIFYEIQYEPFIAFDIFRGKKRLCYGEFRHIAGISDFITPRLIAIGHRAFSINDVMERSKHQKFDTIQSNEEPEGVIYRVERNGKVDFLAKYVRSDFIPGKYLPEISGGVEVFNNIKNYNQCNPI